MKAYELDGKMYTVKGKNLVPLTPVKKVLKAKPVIDAMKNFRAYLEKPSIVQKFGLATIQKLEEGTHTRKDGVVIPVRLATLSNGTTWKIGKATFWKN